MTKFTRAILIGGSALAFCGIVGVAANSNQTPSRQFNIPKSTTNSAEKQLETKKPVTKSSTETKYETETVVIPHSTTYRDDASLAAGSEVVEVAGQNGEEEKKYKVTYRDGLEVSRELMSTTATRAAVDTVIVRGTQSCANGTYINSAGNTVCRPSTQNAGGATAICRDGSYSYSQSRRGTCSYHGGVAQWL